MFKKLCYYKSSGCVLVQETQLFIGFRPDWVDILLNMSSRFRKFGDIIGPSNFFLLLLCASVCLSFHSAYAQRFEKIGGKSGRGSTDSVKWGSQFAVPLDGSNVELGCTSPGGKPVCCVATSEGAQVRGVGYGMEDDANFTGIAANTAAGTCTTEKKYFSSAHEMREITVAERIGKIGAAELAAYNDNGQKDEVDSGTRLPLHVHTSRLNALLGYVTSPESVSNATTWLGRVKEHMKSELVPDETSADREFLSRFEFIETCDGKIARKWTEWIEPLTVTARHPFGFGNCRPAHAKYSESKSPRKPRSDVDYVLLQSGKQLVKQEKSAARSGVGKGKVKGKGDLLSKRPMKHFMLDAGTSTFDSSLYWFTCAFSQRKVAFNDVFGWEMTLLNPAEYWAKVPPKWLPYWHFYNSPISADESQAQSPVRLLKSMATPDDFVAFKLDIDHPDTENPVAMSLLHDTAFSSLVDEFFFELHFRCEVMTSCGWGKQVPESLAGLKLERADVLKYFKRLRELGIRAHIWP